MGDPSQSLVPLVTGHSNCNPFMQSIMTRAINNTPLMIGSNGVYIYIYILALGNSIVQLLIGV